MKKVLLIVAVAAASFVVGTFFSIYTIEAAAPCTTIDSIDGPADVSSQGNHDSIPNDTVPVTDAPTTTTPVMTAPCTTSPLAPDPAPSTSQTPYVRCQPGYPASYEPDAPCVPEDPCMTYNGDEGTTMWEIRKCSVATTTLVPVTTPVPTGTLPTTGTGTNVAVVAALALVAGGLAFMVRRRRPRYEDGTPMVPPYKGRG